jgi:ribonuclease T1
MVFKGLNKLVLTSFLLVSMVMCGGVQARELAATSAIDTTVALNELPPQGIEIYRLIHQGGPFPYGKDGVIFGNRERLLPAQKRGYYREYTVKTPRSSNRGARRIVCGGPATTPDTCFYTADHYASFRKIVP